MSEQPERSLLEAIERRVRARLEQQMPRYELDQRLADIRRQIDIAKKGG